MFVCFGFFGRYIGQGVQMCLILGNVGVKYNIDFLQNNDWWLFYEVE